MFFYPTNPTSLFLGSLASVATRYRCVWLHFCMVLVHNLNGQARHHKTHAVFASETFSSFLGLNESDLNHLFPVGEKVGLSRLYRDSRQVDPRKQHISSERARTLQTRLLDYQNKKLPAVKLDDVPCTHQHSNKPSRARPKQLAKDAFTFHLLSFRTAGRCLGFSITLVASALKLISQCTRSLARGFTTVAFLFIHNSMAKTFSF